MRENRLGGVGLSVVTRAESAARGRSVWYSSLMLDVARLYRRGDVDTASVVLGQANELIAHRAARFVSEGLVTSGSVPDGAELDALTGGALSRFALLTASRREQLASRLQVRCSTGTVVGRVGDLAVVETEDGLRLGIPVPAEPASLGALGAHVAVDAETLDGRSSFMWVRPAMQLEGDRHGRVPGKPRLLAGDERRRFDRDVLVVG